MAGYPDRSSFPWLFAWWLNEETSAEKPSAAGTWKQDQKGFFFPFHYWTSFNQKLRAILKENWNREPGPTLTKHLSLFISVIKTLRTSLSTGSPWRQIRGLGL